MNQRNSHTAVWCRVLAIVLAVSMVLIPVSFPGSAEAAEPAPGANTGSYNIAENDWAEFPKLSTVTGSWTYPSGKTVEVKDGRLDVKNSDNYALLSVKQEEAAEPQVWEDHTIELVYDYGTGWITSGAQQGILAKVTQNQDNTFNAYYFRVSFSDVNGDDKANTTNPYADNKLNLGVWRSENVVLSYGDKDITNEITDTAKQLQGLQKSDVALSYSGSGDGKVKIKLVFSGKTITAYMAATDGEYAQVFTVNDETPLAPGTVGLFRGSDASDSYGWTRADSIKVTNDATSVVAYEDDFDNTVLTGKQYTPTYVSSVKQEDVTFDWTVSNSGVSVIDNDDSSQSNASGFMLLTGSNMYAYLKATAGDVDVHDYWTDYAIETTIDLSTYPASNYMYGILGRVTPATSGNNFYCIRVSHDPTKSDSSVTARLYKGTGASNGNIGTSVDKDPSTTQSDNVQGSIALDESKLVTVKTEFSGNTIRVWLKTTGEYTTEPQLTYTDTDNPYTHGFAGIAKQSGDPSGKTWNLYVDSFEVTAADGTVLFSDDFAATTEKPAESYLSTPTVVKDGFTHPSWKATEGKVDAIAPNGGQQYVVTDGSASWSDYAVAADVTLSTPGSYAGLIAHASENGRYELRMATDGLKLYHVPATGAVPADPIASATGTYALNTSYALKLEVSKDGKTVKAYVDGEQLDLNPADTEKMAAEITEGVLAQGTAGMSAQGVVTFANFAATYDLADCLVHLSLDGDIALNYDFTLADEIVKDSTAYFQVTPPEKAPTKVMVSELAPTSEGYYVVTGLVAAKEMSKPVKVELFRGNTPTLVYSYKYSVMDYANLIRSMEEYDNGTLEALATAMLNYGAYAQTHFSYNTEGLANASLVDTEKTLTAVDADNLTKFTDDKAIADITYKGYKLILESETTLRQYFTVTGDIKDYTFAWSDGAEAEVVSDGENGYYVDRTNIAAQDLDTVYTLTIKKDSSTRTITCSAMSYARTVLKAEISGEVTQALKDVVTAMYYYNQAANAYFTPAN